jgi:hypothetical protein
LSAGAGAAGAAGAAAGGGGASSFFAQAERPIVTTRVITKNIARYLRIALLLLSLGIYPFVRIMAVVYTAGI